MRGTASAMLQTARRVAEAAAAEGITGRAAEAAADGSRHRMARVSAREALGLRAKGKYENRHKNLQADLLPCRREREIRAR